MLSTECLPFCLTVLATHLLAASTGTTGGNWQFDNVVIAGAAWSPSPSPSPGASPSASFTPSGTPTPSPSCECYQLVQGIIG